MVTLCWLNAGIIHRSFLPNGTSITADVYCEELGTVIEKLANLLPALRVNCLSVVRLPDEARPHAAQRGVQRAASLWYTRVYQFYSLFLLHLSPHAFIAPRIFSKNLVFLKQYS